MIILADKLNCTGCHACMNVCAKNAISMVEDEEGFLQPHIDVSLCIGCGLCEKKCPVLLPLRCDLTKQKVYAVINPQDRNVSSSGGAFSMFARYVLSKKGVVFGATIDENLQVYHIGIQDLKELYKLRGAKYVQSKIGNTYRETKKFLQDGRNVLFCGTPCQIAGLYAFLGKRWEEHLITLDLVCHGVPNQKTFNTYLSKLASFKNKKLKDKNIRAFRFRNLESWSIVPAFQVAESKRWHMLDQEHNVFMNAYFRGSIYRESCFKCKYANINRIGTFTLADFWGIGAQGIKFSRNIAKGVSMVIDNYGLMDCMKANFDKNIYIEERTMEEARVKNTPLNRSVERLSERDDAVLDLLKEGMTLKQYAIKYRMLDSCLKNLIKTTFRDIVYRLNLYNIYKTIIYKLGKTS